MSGGGTDPWPTPRQSSTQMPELPEVETHIVELRPLLEGRRVEGASVFWPRTIAEPDPDRFCDLIRNRRFGELQRRAKYMLLGLDAGWTLVVHLRMTGTLRVVPSDREMDRHTQVVLGLEGGEELRYLDLRKFGRFWLVRDADRVLPSLGPEPLSRHFTGRWLHGALARRQAAIKAVLLDQSVGAGVGNIYADEALFRARIHPERPAASLTLKECQTLCRTIRHVLRTGIAWRGSFVSSYEPPSGVPGRFQARHQVFRRTGEPCPRCRTVIERIRVGQRSTHYCPACQQVSV